MEWSLRLLKGRQIAAVATAFALPLSTSAQAIAVATLAVFALLTLDRDRLRVTLRRPAAFLPVALATLIFLGVAWSIQPASLAIKSVEPYAKLLLIPLLMATAFTRRQALQIAIGFVAGCAVVLALSWAYMLWPSGPWAFFKSPGVAFKDNAVQSECFALCAFGLAVAATHFWSIERRIAIGLGAFAFLFFSDIFLIYVSKTGLLVAIILLALFLIHASGWRRAILIAVPALFIAAVALWSSPLAQPRLADISNDISARGNGGAETISTASRLDFWSKALSFLKQAPIIGHGTGSIKPLYQSLEATNPSPFGQATTDPHNQVLHTVLQVGLLGGSLLIAMWAVHIRLFMGTDSVAIFGQAVVIQNVVGSLFNSHLSQVTQGMLYCTAVGLLGSILKNPRSAQAADLNVEASAT